MKEEKIFEDLLLGTKNVELIEAYCDLKSKLIEVMQKSDSAIDKQDSFIKTLLKENINKTP